MRRFVHVALLLIVLASFTVSARAQAQTADPTLLDLISQDKNLSTFRAALKTLNLDSSFSSNSGVSFTVLAPTNAAFKNALSTLGITSTQLFSDKVRLFKLIYGTILPGWMESYVLAAFDGYRVATLLWGQAPMVSVSDGVVSLDSARIGASDQFASNGVLHIIDEVLIPNSEALAMGNREIIFAAGLQKQTKNALQVISGSRTLTTFKDGVNAANGLADLLANKGNSYTIFAPADESFDRALSQINVTTATLVGDVDTITELLRFHIVPFTYNLEVLKTYDNVILGTIINNTGIVINVKSGSVYLSGVVPLTTTDINASNAIVHQMGGVLVPPSLLSFFGLGSTPTAEPTPIPTRRPAVTATPRAPTRAATAIATPAPTRVGPIDIGEETAEPTAIR